MNIHVLVGVCRSDLLEGHGSPVVAGCLDGVIWEHCDEETVEEMWSAMKARLDPGDASYYEWREVVVEMEELDVMEAFKTTVVAGKVVELCPKCGTTGEACPLGNHDACPYDDPDVLRVLTASDETQERDA